jgi:hypothetical protein
LPVGGRKSGEDREPGRETIVRGLGQRRRAGKEERLADETNVSFFDPLEKMRPLQKHRKNHRSKRPAATTAESFTLSGSL